MCQAKLGAMILQNKGTFTDTCFGDKVIHFVTSVYSKSQKLQTSRYTTFVYPGTDGKLDGALT